MGLKHPPQKKKTHSENWCWLLEGDFLHQVTLRGPLLERNFQISALKSHFPVIKPCISKTFHDERWTKRRRSTRIEIIPYMGDTQVRWAWIGRCKEKRKTIPEEWRKKTIPAERLQLTQDCTYNCPASFISLTHSVTYAPPPTNLTQPLLSLIAVPFLISIQSNKEKERDFKGVI